MAADLSLLPVLWIFDTVTFAKCILHPIFLNWSFLVGSSAAGRVRYEIEKVQERIGLGGIMNTHQDVDGYSCG